MTQTLERATPESVGISSNTILELVDELERTGQNAHSLMVVRHGRVAAEAWWAPMGPQVPHELFSLTKSFTATATAFAIDEGLLSLDDSVTSFFPDEAPARVGPNLAAMKVRHLLAMCTGHSEPTDDRVFGGQDRNLVRSFLSLPVEDPPGTRFIYNTGASHVLSAIVQKRTGSKLIDYLQPRLFEPLGIENVTWDQDSHGINMGGFGMHARTEDIARFGQLYLQKGVWGGRQLLRPDWVEAATSLQIATSANPVSNWDLGYGYQFWRGRHDSYRADGAFGQYAVVVPAQDLVVAITAGSGTLDKGLDCLWKVLLPGLQPAELPADPAAHRALTERLSGLALVPRAGAVSSVLEDELDGAEFAVDPNPFGMTAIRFEFSPRGGVLAVSRNSKLRASRLCFDRGAWRDGRSTLVPQWRGQPLVASGAWPSPDCLEIDACFYTGPFRYTLRCDFSDGQVRLSTHVNVAFGPTDLGVLVAKRETYGATS